MIQTGETCSYEGNPTNDVYCNYTDESLSTTNPVPENVQVRETTNDIVVRFGDGHWIAPNTSSGYNDDGTKQRDGTRFLLKGHVKSEFLALLKTPFLLKSKP